MTRGKCKCPESVLYILNSHYIELLVFHMYDFKTVNRKILQRFFGIFRKIFTGNRLFVPSISGVGNSFGFEGHITEKLGTPGPVIVQLN